jgi:hypothetical protein
MANASESAAVEQAGRAALADELYDLRCALARAASGDRRF